MSVLRLVPLALLGFAAAAGCARPEAPPAAASAPAFEEILKIDVHTHVFEDVPALNDMLRKNRVHIINVAVPATDGHLERMHQIGAQLARTYPDLFHFASTFDLTRRAEPGYHEAVNAALDRTFADGAVMTKIWKEVGLDIKRPDGSFHMPDDELFDPIYAHLAERGKPLLAHLAEPLEAWQPLDPNGVHYSYYSRNPRWHLYGKPEYPSHADIIAARDRVLERHPTLTLIGAHLGSLEHDVDEVAKRLDRYPNFHVEVSARTRDLTHQPSDKVRAFFLKYQDRILYGVDRTWKPYRSETPPTDDARAAFVRGLEEQYRRDFAYYAGTGQVQYGDRQIEALGLPREVLEKFYYRNAQRLIPELANVKPS